MAYLLVPTPIPIQLQVTFCSDYKYATDILHIIACITIGLMVYKNVNMVKLYHLGRKWLQYQYRLCSTVC